MPRLIAPVVQAGSLARIDPPVLRGGAGVILRPWSRGDAEAVADAFQDPDIQRWHFLVLDAAEAREWIDAWGPRWRAETDASWAVCEEPAGEAGGYVAVRNLSLEFGLGSISYWIRPAFRRRGLATAATRSVAIWALDDLGLHRLEIRHSVGNPESCRVATDASFPLESTMRSALRHADGWHDVHVHARLSRSTGTGGPVQ